MRIAFYAPMKPPDHPVPSGDRAMARLLIEALERAGHQVELACRLIGRDPVGDPVRQARFETLGQALAGRYARRHRPDLWFTYHLYYKAPDWVGPAVCRALALPYLVAEASVAPKRAGGPWNRSHRAVLAALDQAARVIALNPSDRACLPDLAKVRDLAPFLDPAPYRAARAQGAAQRVALAQRLGLDAQIPWLVAAAMMRPGDKLASYQLLAQALGQLDDRPWCLLVAGDGPARGAVEQALGGNRVRFLGALEKDALAALYGAGDIMVWPAINEAYGMALLEAQAAGLPVVAGASGGVSGIVRDQVTGLLCPPGDADAFATHLRRLLDDPALRARLSSNAAETVARDHGLDRASQALEQILREAIALP